MPEGIDTRDPRRLVEGDLDRARVGAEPSFSREFYGDWCDIMVVSWNYASAHGEGKELLIRPRY
jgi:hypothetical protein